MILSLRPVTLREANAFIARVHRHHPPARGCVCVVGLVAVSTGRFLGAAQLDALPLAGVAVVGRPVARALQDGWTAEVTRLATSGAPNACSKLYGAAWRAVRALGYRRLVTYTLASEPGTSLRAAGFFEAARVTGRSWHCASRPRTDKHPTVDKIRWEMWAQPYAPGRTAVFTGPSLEQV